MSAIEISYTYFPSNKVELALTNQHK